jgi:replicative DNA helicase
VIVGAQVNRETVESDGTTVQPELHHIREADDLANDAAGMLTLHREKLKLPGENSGYADGKEMHIKIVKNRDGKRGKVVTFQFEGESGRITQVGESSAAPALAIDLTSINAKR